jgi:hypothetical protein
MEIKVIPLVLQSWFKRFYGSISLQHMGLDIGWIGCYFFCFFFIGYHFSQVTVSKKKFSFGMFVFLFYFQCMLAAFF